MKYNSSILGCDHYYVLYLELHEETYHLENVFVFDDATTKLLSLTKKNLCLLSSEPQSIIDISTRFKHHHFLFTLSIKTIAFNGVECVLPTLIDSDLCSKFISCHFKNPQKNELLYYVPCSYKDCHCFGTFKLV